jgi:hypothetical protein
MTLFWKTIIGVLGLTVLTMGKVRAEEAQDTKNTAVLDCRYEQSDSGTSSSAFPSDDVFRPLMADPNSRNSSPPINLFSVKSPQVP